MVRCASLEHLVGHGPRTAKQHRQHEAAHHHAQQSVAKHTHSPTRTLWLKASQVPAPAAIVTPGSTRRNRCGYNSRLVTPTRMTGDISDKSLVMKWFTRWCLAFECGRGERRGCSRAEGDQQLDSAKQLTFHACSTNRSMPTSNRRPQRRTGGEDLSRAKFQAGLPPVVQHVPDQGKWGGSLRFKDVSPQVLFYRGQGNVPYSTDGFDLTVSFWMKLDPEQELKPGYVDPMQITDDAWNNSCLFVDFTKDEVPRHFRLGVFSDYTFWNPKDTPWENIADTDRPMVTVKRHPFRGDQWTHVAFTLQGVNTPTECTSKFYLNGQLQGGPARPKRSSPGIRTNWPSCLAFSILAAWMTTPCSTLHSRPNRSNSSCNSSTESPRCGNSMLLTRLGSRFDATAILVGDRIDLRGADLPIIGWAVIRS